MDKAKRRQLLALTECSIMIALSTVLSIIKIVDLPCGGAITAASMLPIVIAVYRHGALWGLGVAAVNSVIQLLLGLNNLSYAVNWQAAVAIILFDYVIAFSVFALSGVFKNWIKDQSAAVVLGVILSSVLRYTCHTIVGCTVWAGISIPTTAAILYSLSYNATYMIPETIILSLAAGYVLSLLDLRAQMPRRIQRGERDALSVWCSASAGVTLLGGVAASVAIIFSKLQNEESGELDFGGFANVNYTALGITLGACILVAAALYLVVKQRDCKKKKG